MFSFPTSCIVYFLVSTNTNLSMNFQLSFKVNLQITDHTPLLQIHKYLKLMLLHPPIPQTAKFRVCVANRCLLGAVLRFGGGYFSHFPPQTFYRIKPTTPSGENNSFWHPRTTSTPAVSADQTPTHLQYSTGTLELHLQLRLC